MIVLGLSEEMSFNRVPQVLHWVLPDKDLSISRDGDKVGFNLKAVD